MTELLPGVWPVDGSVGCVTYLIVDADGVTLVDTGLRGNVPRIYATMRKAGRGPKDLKRIIVTHAHLDHINCLHKLKADTGAIVIAGEKDAGIISGKKPLNTMRGLFGVVFGALRLYYRYKPVPVDRIIKDGEKLDILGGLEAVSLPGHSAGNTGLYSASRKAFFTSDSIRVAGGKLLPPHPKFTADYPEALRSVGRIAGYEFETLLPGHGSPVSPDAAKKVRALYEEIKDTQGVK